jgi:hypothetical protein
MPALVPCGVGNNAVSVQLRIERSAGVVLERRRSSLQMLLWVVLSTLAKP